MSVALTSVEQEHDPDQERGVGQEFLACQGVALRLGEKVVFGGTDWLWREGEQWAVLGPDGSGKSLLIRAILGQVPLARGEIRGPHGTPGAPELAPEDAIVVVSPDGQRELLLSESTFYQSRWHSGLREGCRTVADILSQDSVEERNPFEVRARQGNSRAFQVARRQFMRWLGMEHLMGRSIMHLSNGELRKILLVHALLRAPRLLILDDPYAGLDEATRGKLSRVIARLMQKGWPVLFVTHRLEDIPDTSTHLLLVDHCRIVAQGCRRQVLKAWGSRLHSITKPICRPAKSRDFARSNRRQPAFGDTCVELENVTIVGGRKRILSNISWQVRQGECWAVLGANGAGKTTLLNLIQGDHPQAYSQAVRLFGRGTESTQTVWQSRQEMGWMSPELHQHYPPDWSVLDVVSSGFFNTLGLFETCSGRQRATALAWLEDLGLSHKGKEPFGQLPFGEQRLALLARAAVKSPRLLILDEPCQGLDAQQRWRLLAVLDRIVAQGSSSLIFVTHRPQELPRCITHVLRLKAGRVLSARPENCAGLL